MKRLLALFCLLPVIAFAQTANVTYRFTDFQVNPLKVVRAEQTPLAPFADYNGAILAPYARAMVTDTNGSVTFSNTVSGYAYRIAISTPYGVTTRTCGIPVSVSGNINGRDYLGDVKREAFYYLYPSVTNMAQVAIDFGFITNRQSGVTLTNLQSYGGTITIKTNAASNVLLKSPTGVDLLTWDDSAEQFNFNTNFTISGNGVGLQFLEAGNIASGTVPLARLPTSAFVGSTNGTGYTNTLYNANIVTPAVWLMCGFDNGWPYRLWLFYSVDGIKFDYLIPEPIYTAKAGSQITRDPRFLVTSTNIYIAVTGPTDSVNNWIFASTNYATWTSNQVINTAKSSGIGHAWAPRWYGDATNGLHYINNQSTNGTTGFAPVELHLTNPNDFSTWGGATELGGWRANVWSNTLDADFVYLNSVYWSFFKQEDAVNLNAGAYIGLASNATPVFTNGWYLVRSNDWAGWGGVGYEAPSVFVLPNGNLSVYFEQYSGAAYYRAECPAATAPLTGWGPKQRLILPRAVSNSGFLMVTNTVEVARILSAAMAAKQPTLMFDIPHSPYYDTVIGANIRQPDSLSSSSTYQYMDSLDTNRTSIYLNFYTGAGDPSITIYNYPKNGIAGGVRNTWGYFDTNGWRGQVLYTTNADNGVLIDASRQMQQFITNASFTVSGFSGLVTNAGHMFGMTVSNSSGSSIIWTAPSNCHFPTNGVSTNAMTIPAGQQMKVSFEIWPRFCTNFMNVIIR